MNSVELTKDSSVTGLYIGTSKAIVVYTEGGESEQIAEFTEYGEIRLLGHWVEDEVLGFIGALGDKLNDDSLETGISRVIAYLERRGVICRYCAPKGEVTFLGEEMHNHVCTKCGGEQGVTRKQKESAS